MHVLNIRLGSAHISESLQIQLNFAFGRPNDSIEHFCAN